MPIPVVFAPEAEQQLLELYRYIAASSSNDTAARYTEALIAHCESLETFPTGAHVAMTSGPASA